MPLRCRCLLSAAVALVAVHAAAEDIVQRDGVWAQDYVGRPADPTVIFGRLPNGMRFAIRHNDTPPGQMSVRLLIAAGSLNEPDGSEGIAHFVEHMAFRGSTHVPDGELARILQRQGLAFGPDTNASTTQEATVYQFDFPRSDSASLESALMLMRETASELQFPAAAVDAERGVVLAEERERANPAFEAQKALLSFILPGQLAARRWPIGLPDVIAHATPDQLRAFYRANYRPDKATLVIVGDVDPAAVAARIRAVFGDWAAAAGPATHVDQGAVAPRGETVAAFTVAGAPQFIQLTWIRPADLTADTAARERRDLVRSVAAAILNRRLREIAQAPSPPFVGASYSWPESSKAADLTTLSLSIGADGWQTGLAAVVAEQRRIVRDGVTAHELDQTRAEYGSYFVSLAARENTRPSPGIANAVVGEAAGNGLLTSPAQDLATWHRLAAGITVADVDAALRQAFTGSGPAVFAASPLPIAGGIAAVRAAFDAANTAPLSAPAAAVAAAWPYASFGPAGAIIARRTVDDLGVTAIRFANGDTLTVKPTSFAKDEILIDAAFGHGRSQLPQGLARSAWLTSAFVPGGTAKLTATQITNLLAGQVASVALSVDDTAYVLRGRTRPADLATDLQLLTAYYAEPGYRPEAVARLRSGLAAAEPQIEASPGAVLARDFARITHDGDARWSGLPRAGELAAVRPGDLKAVVRPALDDGPVDVTIVGDVTVDAAIAATAATFGALPRHAATVPAVAAVRFPPVPAAPIVLTHTGRADQAIAVETWPTTGLWGHETDSRAMTVAMQIIQTRLFDTLRAVDGATYSPSAGSDFSSEFDGYGVASITVAIPPARIAEFTAGVGKVIADLAAKPVSDDELARARTPLIEARLRDRETNGYWLGALAGSVREPRRLGLIRDRVAAMRAVPAADIQRVVGTYLTTKPLEIVIRP